MRLFRNADGLIEAQYAMELKYLYNIDLYGPEMIFLIRWEIQKPGALLLVIFDQRLRSQIAQAFALQLLVHPKDFLQNTKLQRGIQRFVEVQVEAAREISQ